jgi:hypothetical protein
MTNTSARALIASLCLAIAPAIAAPALADTTIVTSGGAAASFTTVRTAIVPVTHRIVHKTYRCASVTAYGLDYVASRSTCTPVYWVTYYTTYHPVTIRRTETAIVPAATTYVSTLP